MRTALLVLLGVVVAGAIVVGPSVQERRTAAHLDAVAADLERAAATARSQQDEWHERPHAMALGLGASYGVALDTVWSDDASPTLCLVARHHSLPGRAWMTDALDGAIHEGDCR